MIKTLFFLHNGLFECIFCSQQKPSLLTGIKLGTYFDRLYRLKKAYTEVMQRDFKNDLAKTFIEKFFDFLTVDHEDFE